MSYLEIAAVAIVFSVIVAALMWGIRWLGNHIRDSRLYTAADTIRLAYRVFHEESRHPADDPDLTEQDITHLRWAMEYLDRMREADVDLAFEIVERNEEYWARTFLQLQDLKRPMS